MATSVPERRLFVPFPRPDLIGRDDAVEHLHVLLQSGHAALTPALTGQGGIGKTQLAVCYAYDKAGTWPGGVFWLNAAGDADPVPRQLGERALELGLGAPSAAGDTSEYYRQLALLWCGQVGSRTDALLIADNVEDGAFLARDLPGLPGRRLTALGCRVLVTSRATDLPGCTEVKVDFLEPQDAKELLLLEAGRPDDGSAGLGTIIRMLGGLPLALKIAGAYLRQFRSATFGKFAQVLSERGALQVLDAAGHQIPDYKDGMAVSLSALLAASWDALPPDRPALKDLMKALGCLPETEHIRLALLRHLIDCPPDPLGLDDDPFATTTNGLERRNLVELVHDYSRNQADARFRDDLIVRAATRLRSADYLVGADADELLTLLRELPMLEAMSHDPAEARQGLFLLRRNLDCQAGQLRRGARPLAQLHRQAHLLEDDALERELAAAFGRDDRLRQLWSTARTDRAEVRVLRGHEGHVSAVAFSPDGVRLASASEDFTVRLWAADGAGEPRVLRGDGGRVTAVAFSPDGLRLASASGDGTVRVWAADGAGEPRILRGHEHWVTAVAFSPEFSPDGARLASASSDGTVRLWAADGAGEPRILRGHKHWVTAVAFGPDGVRLASASHDGTVRLWAASGEPVATMAVGGVVMACPFHPDGRRIGLGTSLGEVAVLEVIP